MVYPVTTGSSEVLIGILQVAGRRVRAYMAEDETYWRVVYEHGVDDNLASTPTVILNERFSPQDFPPRGYGHARRTFDEACSVALMNIGSVEFHMAPHLMPRDLAQSAEPVL